MKTLKNNTLIRRNRSIMTSRKHGGFTLMDFIFWMVVASFSLALLIGLYNKGTSMMASSSTASDVTSIKAAASEWKGARTNLTGINITELCKAGNGNIGATWCGSDKNGVAANPYGGNYSVTVGSNVSQITVTITNVDKNNLNVLATKLAPISAERCASMPCSSVIASGTGITVTL